MTTPKPTPNSAARRNLGLRPPATQPFPAPLTPTPSPIAEPGSADLPAPPFAPDWMPAPTRPAWTPSPSTWLPVRGSAGWRVVVAAAGVGVLSAIMLPNVGPGLGWWVMAAATAVAIGWARHGRAENPPASSDRPVGPGVGEGSTGAGVGARREGRAGTRWWARGIAALGGPTRVQRIGWGGLGLALAAVPVFRDAVWLCALCLLAAAWAGALAVTGGANTRTLAFSVVAVPVAALRGLPWAVRGVAAVRGRDGRGAGRLVAAGLVGVLLSLLFGGLFVDADAAFAHLITAALSTVDVNAAVWAALVFVLAASGVVGACYLLVSMPKLDDVARTGGRLRRWEWAVPVGALVVLFATFVGVQVADLFGGRGYVLRTAGLTYAQYARTGFWQLSTVTVLTLPVIVGAAWLADRERDRNWLRGLLGALAGLTVVIVASALSRMWAYQQAYGFTVLRLLVFGCELWLGLVYLLVLAAGVRLRGGWLPRTAVATGMGALLVLALLNPDGVIAEQDIARYPVTDQLDLDYLTNLSPDAVPALLAAHSATADCVLAGIGDRLAGESDDWRMWNAGRATARTLLGPVPVTARCWSS